MVILWKIGSRSTKKWKGTEEVKEQRMWYEKRGGNEEWKMQEGEDETKKRKWRTNGVEKRKRRGEDGGGRREYDQMWEGREEETGEKVEKKERNRTGRKRRSDNVQ